MAGEDRQAKQSGDLRLGDALVGIPCLRRQRGGLAAGLRDQKRDATVSCPVCGIEVPQLIHELREGERMVIGRVQQRFPGWQPEDGLCGPCLGRFGESGESG